ncbi:MAG: hypothetical protein JF614_14305 [Acidobacteria bacterium]|nr:hypothetical protein [Acidobacteriota bacterium]
MYATGFALLLIALVLFVLGRMAGVRVRQLQRSQEVRSEFYRSAMILVEDERTPEAYVGLLGSLSRALVDKRLSWIALWHLVSGKRNLAPRERDLTFLHPLPADLRKVWDHITGCFVLAVTFNNFLIGAIVRRLFLWLANGRNDEGDSRRATAVVQDLVTLRSA